VDSDQPGCLLLKLSRPTGTIQNLTRYTTDEHLVEDQWHVARGTWPWAGAASARWAPSTRAPASS